MKVTSSRCRENPQMELVEVCCLGTWARRPVGGEFEARCEARRWEWKKSRRHPSCELALAGPLVMGGAGKGAGASGGTRGDRWASEAQRNSHGIDQ